MLWLSYTPPGGLENLDCNWFAETMFGTRGILSLRDTVNVVGCPQRGMNGPRGKFLSVRLLNFASHLLAAMRCGFQHPCTDPLERTLARSSKQTRGHSTYHSIAARVAGGV